MLSSQQTVDFVGRTTSNIIRAVSKAIETRHASKDDAIIFAMGRMARSFS